MGRKRKSLDELSLSGTLKQNPKRYKERLTAQSAPSDPLGDPPVRLPQGAKTAWAEISSTRPWLTAADRLDVELAATLTAKMRNPKTEATRADLALLQRTLAAIDKKEKKRPSAPESLPKELQPVVDKQLQADIQFCLDMSLSERDLDDMMSRFTESEQAPFRAEIEERRAYVIAYQDRTQRMQDLYKRQRQAQAEGNEVLANELWQQWRALAYPDKGTA